MVQRAGLQASAPPRHPQRFFVTDFVGSTNLVPGEIVGSPDARALLTVRTPAGDAVVRPSPVRTGAVLLAIRLHRLQLAAPGSEWPKVNAWTAYFGRINDLGGRLQVVPHLSAKTELVVDVVNSTAFTFRQGEKTHRLLQPRGSLAYPGLKGLLTNGKIMCLRTERN